MQDVPSPAVDTLLAAWREHRIIEHLPPAQMPPDPAAGYAVQDAVIAALAERVPGYKVAATSPAGRAHISVTHPISGQLPASRVLRPGALVGLGGNGMRVAEAEFVFVLRNACGPRETAMSTPEVMALVSELRLGIELPNSRFADFTGAGAAQLAADNACACWFVLGPPVTADWRDADLAGHAVRTLVDGETVSRGSGGDALGDPRIALCWFVNHYCVERRRALPAGSFVTTGVCGRPAPIEPGQTVTVDFGAFGSLDVRLDAD